MSINTLTNAALARRPDMVPAGTVPRSIRQRAGAALAPPRAADAAPESAPEASKTETALNLLAGYIPAEVLTVYVGLNALLDHDDGLIAPERSLFWLSLFATPIVLWFVFAGKLRERGKPLPLPPRTWPVWEAFAATVAFAVWAIALPDSPFATEPWYTPVLTGGAVLVTSTLLGLISGVMQNPLGTGKTDPKQSRGSPDTDSVEDWQKFR